jgi:predicted RecA/RadA family phage recombinase
MDNLVSDGNAVNVVLAQTVTKGQPVFADGFHGVAMTDGVSGDTIAIETSNREFEHEVAGALAVAKGDVLYITTDGTDVVSKTNTGRLFGVATTAKDSNNVIWYKLLENRG